jgi:hypothetical protein
MTPEIEASVATLFSTHPTLLQVQYDPAGSFIAWVSVQGDRHNEDDPSSWDSVDFTHETMPAGSMRDDVLAWCMLCDAHHDDMGTVSTIWHRNPAPLSVMPVNDEKVKFAQVALEHRIETAENLVRIMNLNAREAEIVTAMEVVLAKAEGPLP